MKSLRKRIRDIPDFPKQGIIFKDITPLLIDPESLKLAVTSMAEQFKDAGVTKVCAVEARGFIFGAAVACELGAGFVPIRKPGKLPSETRCCTYELEYGTDTIEIHEDAIAAGDKVLMVDDLLATGGTMAAACKLVSELGGEIVGVAFLVELAFLNGAEKLKDWRTVSLITFE
jgi:adenine phosphoribosyltransferase